MSNDERDRLPRRRKVFVKRRQQINRFNQQLALLLTSHREERERGREEEEAEDADDELGEGGDVDESHFEAISECGQPEASVSPPDSPVPSDQNDQESNHGVQGMDSPVNEEELLTSQRIDEESQSSGDEPAVYETENSDDEESSQSEESDYSDRDLDAVLEEGSNAEGPSDELHAFLADWIVSENIPGTSANKLLKGLKGLNKQGDTFSSLPQDARTFLKTPRNVIVDAGNGGTYYHFGFERGIISRLRLLPTENFPRVAKVFINMDGIPLCKSSQSDFWPILGLLTGEQTPFPIGIFHGPQKPHCPNVYLRKFAEEALHLKNNGLSYRGRHLHVRVHGLCLDAPARSFVSGIVGHTGYHSCPKCTTSGSYYKKPGRHGGRVVYPDMDSALRTHQSFVDRDDPDHHTQRTILEDLGIDMVLDLPTDYMHLVCIGVMKKLLKTWKKRATSHHLITPEQVGLSTITTSLYIFTANYSFTSLTRWKRFHVVSLRCETRSPVNLQDNQDLFMSCQGGKLRNLDSSCFILALLS